MPRLTNCEAIVLRALDEFSNRHLVTDKMRDNRVSLSILAGCIVASNLAEAKADLVQAGVCAQYQCPRRPDSSNKGSLAIIFREELLQQFWML
jgi:hypothetical protein